MNTRRGAIRGLAVGAGLGTVAVVGAVIGHYAGWNFATSLFEHFSDFSSVSAGFESVGIALASVAAPAVIGSGVGAAGGTYVARERAGSDANYTGFNALEDQPQSEKVEMQKEINETKNNLIEEAKFFYSDRRNEKTASEMRAKAQTLVVKVMQTQIKLDYQEQAIMQALSGDKTVITVFTALYRQILTTVALKKYEEAITSNKQFRDLYNTCGFGPQGYLSILQPELTQFKAAVPETIDVKKSAPTSTMLPAISDGTVIYLTVEEMGSVCADLAFKARQKLDKSSQKSSALDSSVARKTHTSFVTRSVVGASSVSSANEKTPLVVAGSSNSDAPRNNY